MSREKLDDGSYVKRDTVKLGRVLHSLCRRRSLRGRWVCSSSAHVKQQGSQRTQFWMSQVSPFGLDACRVALHS